MAAVQAGRAESHGIISMRDAPPKVKSLLGFIKLMPRILNHTKKVMKAKNPASQSINTKAKSHCRISKNTATHIIKTMVVLLRPFFCVSGGIFNFCLLDLDHFLPIFRRVSPGLFYR